jgi:ribose transport system substrate-binding protein
MLACRRYIPSFSPSFKSIEPMNNRKHFLASILISFTLALSGCGGGDKSSGSGDANGSMAPNTSKGVIAYSPLTLSNPFFKIIGDSIEATAKKHGYETLMLDPNEDVKTQSDQIDDVISKQVTAIVLVPCNRISIGPAVKEANKAGIPVFTVDAQCAAEGVEIVSHVGTDNFQGGELAGQAMIDALGDSGGKVLVLDHKIANSCILRVDGFKKVINAHNAGKETGKIEIVAELASGGNRTDSYKATADQLQAHTDLVGVFAINDPGALGAYTAIDEAGRTESIKIIGFDGQMEGKIAIKEGKVYADPIQFPRKMGVQIVEKIISHLAGEVVEKTVLIPTSLYKKADADKDPELK